MPVTVRSFAKINLGLCIGALASGWLSRTAHRLSDHCVARRDSRAGRARHRASRFVATIRAFPGTRRIPAIASSERAMAALRSQGRVVIEIEKRLPVQGGLGGASGNAVAALLALERALKKTAVRRGEAADCGGGRIGFAAVPGRRDGAGSGARGGGLSAAGFAGDCLRGGDAGDWGFDAQGVCGLGCDDGAAEKPAELRSASTGWDSSARQGGQPLAPLAGCSEIDGFDPLR